MMGGGHKTSLDSHALNTVLPCASILFLGITKWGETLWVGGYG